ncbi:MAG TPA: peptide chain release factor N(5)-glutamine methyltransferase [Kiritimatiellia bacterium]|nr:peptide chain release factor N(5)-glutamine methyltransferase [Kiritimatiellia bacterium]HMP35491.1 peptide chain release factor N(5)-glutamine methyltransferase [Kiritimatiellia bacterium]
MMPAGVLRAEGEARLCAAGVADAGAAVAWWMAEVLGVAREELERIEASPAHAARIRAGFERLAHHEPLQYVIGHAPFLDFSVRTDARALVPRPETEELVTRVLAERDFWSRTGLAVADVGTGTGCIALALARSCPNAVVQAIDCSEAALALARENAEALGFAARIRFVHGDLLEGFAPASLDAVVSNPPYIARDVMETLDANVRRFEPRLALDGGADGLDVLRRLLEQTFTVLKNRGRVWLEIGEDQGPAVQAWMESTGYQQVRVHRDFYNQIRFAEGVK